MPAPASRLTIAKKHHRAGDLAEAEHLYRAVLDEEGAPAEAWYLLGVLLHERGVEAEAENALRQAVWRRPDWAAARNHLGIVLARRQRLKEAAEQLGETLRLQPELADAHNNLGLVRRAQGRWDEAVGCFRQALRLQPAHPQARANLRAALARRPTNGAAAPPDAAPEAHLARGLALLSRGQTDQAVAHLQHAVQLRPTLVEAHTNLGLARLTQGRLDEAAAACRRALELRPDHAPAHNNLGLALYRQKQTHEALEHWRQAVHLEPNFPQAHNNLGLALLEQNDLDGAEACLRQALRLQPDFAEAHNNLAVVLSRQRSTEKRQQALAHWREARRLKPDYAEARRNLERALRDGANLSGDEARLRQAVQLKPDSAAAHNNLGLALLERDDLDAAEDSLRQALRLQPDMADAHNNLGVVLSRQGRLEDARASLREALRLRPAFAEAFNNLGTVQHARGDLAAALDCFGQALTLKPDYPDAHANRALSLLLQGQWTEGWTEYEWRWQLKNMRRRTFEQPLWDGAPLEGRTILLHAEQGLGDTLQFIRCAPLVQARGGTVLVLCQKALAPLLSGCPGLDGLLAHGDPLPDFDVHAPLLSLPRLLGTTPDNVPTGIPYLRSDEDRVRRWHLWLSGYRGFKVGIAWQGDRKHRGDRQRSAPLAALAPLAQVPGVQFLSLQKGAGSEQLAECPFAVEDLGTWLDNSGGAFLDTAAVMQNLDLVVCVDTALGHLAGALGVPVWLALSFSPDWRWLLGRADTPWYPAMRLFRQPQPGDWPSVFDEMAAQLQPQAAAITANAEGGRRSAE